MSTREHRGRGQGPTLAAGGGPGSDGARAGGVCGEPGDVLREVANGRHIVRRRYLLLTAVIMFVAGWTGIHAARSVQEARARARGVRHLCMNSLRAVDTALERYRAEHKGAWPRSVDDLVPGYLQRTGDCAREEVGGRRCQYTPPAENAPDTAVIIRCTRTPGVIVVLRKGGEVDMASPDQW